MNAIATAFANFLPYLSAVLAICLTVGGMFAIRNGQQTQLAKFQKDTNDALKQRIEVLEGKITDFEKENVIQRHIIDTITLALKQRGIIITINGDLVTIADAKGTSQHRKRSATTAQAQLAQLAQKPAKPHATSG